MHFDPRVYLAGTFAVIFVALAVWAPIYLIRQLLLAIRRGQFAKGSDSPQGGEPIVKSQNPNTFWTVAASMLLAICVLEAFILEIAYKAVSTTFALLSVHGR
jgi:hypothetical protein